MRSIVLHQMLLALAMKFLLKRSSEPCSPFLGGQCFSAVLIFYGSMIRLERKYLAHTELADDCSPQGARKELRIRTRRDVRAAFGSVSPMRPLFAFLRPYLFRPTFAPFYLAFFSIFLFFSVSCFFFGCVCLHGFVVVSVGGSFATC